MLAISFPAGLAPAGAVPVGAVPRPEAGDGELANGSRNALPGMAVESTDPDDAKETGWAAGAGRGAGTAAGGIGAAGAGGLNAGLRAGGGGWTGRTGSNNGAG